MTRYRATVSLGVEFDAGSDEDAELHAEQVADDLAGVWTHREIAHGGEIVAQDVGPVTPV